MTRSVTDAAEPEIALPALRTPRSAAFAGIAFSILVTVSIVAIRVAMPGNQADVEDWLSDSTRRDLVLFGLALMPFAGIAFLWFVGVLRDRIGAAEDRFFATLFLGSGLLFIAMLFVAAAIAAALVTSFGDSQDVADSAAWTIGRHTGKELLEGGMQMVGVFTIATSTILLRTTVGPRWLAVLGYAIAALLLVAVHFFVWVALLFPIWVLVLSLEILVADFRRTRAASAPAPGE